MENLSTPPQNVPAERPSNYLILAIVTTFLCCNVTGVVSIIYAAQVNAKWEGGNYEGAISDSKNAKLWGLIGLIGGFVLIGLFAVFYGAMFMAALGSSGEFGY
ncbi:MAG: CD225/dispanin family protein [Dokdonia sp.]|jgi:hypothetical protein